MRIIAGAARGRRLMVPDDWSIRPTTDRVRENLFNILAFRVEGVRFLDLFCGVGANGIEALSRGAAHATLIDASEKALRLTRRNLQHCQVAERSICLQLRLPGELPQAVVPFDIVFADPPYDFDNHQELLLTLQQRQCLAPGSVVIIETNHKRMLPETVGMLRQTRRKRYGETALTFYA